MQNKKLSILDLPSSTKFMLDKMPKFPWYKDLWFEIVTTKNLVFSWFRDIYTGVKNIFIYAPIIYKTREWDYDYLLDLISFKLKLMKQDMLSEQLIEDYSKISKTMQEVIDAIYVYKNSLEVYEERHQDELQNIINEKDEDKRDRMTSILYTNMNNFENESFEAIWEKVSENMRSWWS